MFAAIRSMLQSRAHRAVRRPQKVRLGLESLDGRIVPTTLTPYGGWGPRPTVMIAPSPVRTIAMPSPMAMVGKSVTLTKANGFNTGTLTISTMTQMPDGWFTFTGTFSARTELPSRVWTDVIPVTGSIAAPTFGGPLVTTSTLYFHGSVANTGWGYTHHVEYSGALSQGWNDIWTSGNLDACLEYEFDCIGPGRVSVNGTFS